MVDYVHRDDHPDNHHSRDEHYSDRDVLPQLQINTNPEERTPDLTADERERNKINESRRAEESGLIDNHNY